MALGSRSIQNICHLFAATERKSQERLEERHAEMVYVEAGGEAVVEPEGHLAGCGQDEFRYLEVSHGGFPQEQDGPDQHEAKSEIADTAHQSSPPPALSAP